MDGTQHDPHVVSAQSPRTAGRRTAQEPGARPRRDERWARRAVPRQHDAEAEARPRGRGVVARHAGGGQGRGGACGTQQRLRPGLCARPHHEGGRTWTTRRETLRGSPGGEAASPKPSPTVRTAADDRWSGGGGGARHSTSGGGGGASVARKRSLTPVGKRPDAAARTPTAADPPPNRRRSDVHTAVLPPRHRRGAHGAEQRSRGAVRCPGLCPRRHRRQQRPTGGCVGAAVAPGPDRPTAAPPGLS